MRASARSAVRSGAVPKYISSGVWPRNASASGQYWKPSGRPLTELDARRIRRVLDDGLSRLGEVLQSDPAATRQALTRLLAEKVRFTPTALPAGARTYQFEANLALGRILATTRQNDEDVPTGFEPDA